MTPLAMWTMAIICGSVWGGFLFLVIRAYRRESAKRRGE